MTDVEAWRQQRRWSDLMDLMEVDPWSDLMWPRVNPSLPLLLSSCHVFSVPHATLSSLLLHHDSVTQLKIKPRSSSPNLNLTHFLIYRASVQKYDKIGLSLERQAIIPYLRHAFLNTPVCTWDEEQGAWHVWIVEPQLSLCSLIRGGREGELISSFNGW